MELKWRLLHDLVYFVDVGFHDDRQCMLWIQVNDAPFQLVTLSPSLTVVDGYRTLITPDNLLTTDADTPPRHLHYDVIVEPDVGQLRRRDRATGRFRGPITTFSQADVNDGRVEFSHYAGNGSGSFVFHIVYRTCATISTVMKSIKSQTPLLRFAVVLLYNLYATTNPQEVKEMEFGLLTQQVPQIKLDRHCVCMYIYDLNKWLIDWLIDWLMNAIYDCSRDICLFRAVSWSNLELLVHVVWPGNWREVSGDKSKSDIRRYGRTSNVLLRQWLVDPNAGPGRSPGRPWRSVSAADNQRAPVRGHLPRHSSAVPRSAHPAERRHRGRVYTAAGAIIDVDKKAVLSHGNHAMLL